MRRRQLLARVDLLLQKEEEQLHEELRVVERQGPHLEGNVLRGQAREELLVVGVGDGEIKLQLFEELRVSPRGHNNDGKVEYHLLEEQLQLLLEVRLQVLRDDDKNRHDIVEDECVDLLVEEEKRQVAQHRAAHDFEKLGVVG